jgi:hypothetical protein
MDRQGPKYREYRRSGSDGHRRLENPLSLSFIVLRKKVRSSAIIAMLFACGVCDAAPLPDIRSVEQDLHIPAVTDGKPAPGKRVKVWAASDKGSDLYSLLYLPTDWRAGQQYPVIVEYAGNGPFKSKYGDVSDGTVEGNALGYGVSGGKGAIWLCLPYVAPGSKSNQRQWWGDVDATVAYCKKVVPEICRDWGGDPARVILAGFSRGAIACNFIGLHDDEIAKLWCGFICYSHYDGVRKWGYKGSDRASAAVRLKRLGERPQFIIHENSVAATERYLKQVMPDGPFTFVSLGYRNHNASWVLRDTKERKLVRRWFTEVTVSPDQLPNIPADGR